MKQFYFINRAILFHVCLENIAILLWNNDIRINTPLSLYWNIVGCLEYLYEQCFTFSFFIRFYFILQNLMKTAKKYGCNQLFIHEDQIKRLCFQLCNLPIIQVWIKRQNLSEALLNFLWVIKGKFTISDNSIYLVISFKRKNLFGLEFNHICFNGYQQKIDK